MSQDLSQEKLGAGQYISPRMSPAEGRKNAEWAIPTGVLCFSGSNFGFVPPVLRAGLGGVGQEDAGGR
jgi:hypothetical protein